MDVISAPICRLLPTHNELTSHIIYARNIYYIKKCDGKSDAGMHHAHKTITKRNKLNIYLTL